MHPEWMAKVRAEVAQLGAKYSKNDGAPLVDQLHFVPLEAWESELPTLDLCARETVRLHVQLPAIRRNVSADDIRIGDEVIPAGALVVSGSFYESSFGTTDLYPCTYSSFTTAS